MERQRKLKISNNRYFCCLFEYNFYWELAELKNLIVFFKSYKINSIMSSVYDTVMKFLTWKVVWKLWKAFFFLVKTVVKFRNLQISNNLNTDPSRIFPIYFKVMNISLRYKYFEKQFRSKEILLLVWGESKNLNWKYFSEIYKRSNNNL